MCIYHVYSCICMTGYTFSVNFSHSITNSKIWYMKFLYICVYKLYKFVTSYNHTEVVYSYLVWSAIYLGYWPTTVYGY